MFFQVSTVGLKSAGCRKANPGRLKIKKKEHRPACETTATETISCLKNVAGEAEKTDSRRRM